VLGVEDADVPWKVLPVMVSRRVEPAAFAQGMTVTFVTSSDLATILAAEAEPSLGHASTGDQVG
jgi:hypothetical protein